MLKSNAKNIIVFKIGHNFIEGEQAPPFCLAQYLYTGVKRQKRDRDKCCATSFDSDFLPHSL